MFINHAKKETKFMDNEKELLKPSTDVVFQALFGMAGNENITKAFLEAILDSKIEKIDLDKNLVLRRDFRDDKFPTP